MCDKTLKATPWTILFSGLVSLDHLIILYEKNMNQPESNHHVGIILLY